jgi:hypothetical protein
MASNKTTETIIYDNVQSSSAGVVNTASSYTVGANDNLVICGGNTLTITLNGTSNSPVYITSIDSTTQRTGCLVAANGNNYKIEDGGPTAHCIRVAGTALWVIVGAKSIS